MSQEYVIVLTTLPADADGAAFARELVEERLAACVNLSAPMESVYRWEGTVETESERQLVIKTSRDRVVALWDRVRELHPYDMPKSITQPAVDAIRQFVSPGDFVIDIGAHSGDTTVPMALAAGQGGCTLALEPNRYVFKVLAANVTLAAGLRPGWWVLGFGLAVAAVGHGLRLGNTRSGHHT